MVPPNHNTAIAEAFSAVGVLDAKTRALSLLEICWQEQKRINREQPNVTRALQAFADALSETEPLTVYIMGKEFWPRIRAFAQNEHREIRREYARARGLKAGAVIRANAEARGYSASYEAVRKYRPIRPISLPNPTLAPGDNWTIEKNRRCVDRRKRGIVVVKAELDPLSGTLNLISRLPPKLIAMRLNGRSIGDLTTEEALAWCEGREQDAQLVRTLCAMIPDPRQIIGAQLTTAIIKEMEKFR